MKMKLVPISRGTLRERVKAPLPTMKNRNKKIQTRREQMNLQGASLMLEEILKMKKEKHATKLQALFRGALQRQAFQLMMVVRQAVLKEARMSSGEGLTDSDRKRTILKQHSTSRNLIQHKSVVGRTSKYSRRTNSVTTITRKGSVAKKRNSTVN